MEPYYPAGYTQEEIAEMFGIKKNDSIIPPMPQPPARPLSPIDQFARDQIQERKEGRKQAVQYLAQVAQNAKASTSKEVRHIGFRVPAQQMPELEAIANEVYALGGIVEPTVPALMRYSLKFFIYSYAKWVRPSLRELVRNHAESAILRPADQVNKMEQELDSMSTNFGGRGFSG